MTSITLSGYVLGIAITFWVTFIWAGWHETLQSPSLAATTLVSLTAGLMWPLVLVGGIEIWALSALMDRARVRRTVRGDSFA